MGLDPIPLGPSSKVPYIGAWPILDPEDLWEDAQPDSNVGIRCGEKKRLVVIDCDERKQPGTYTRVMDLLTSLGISSGEYPVVQTATSVGRHIYASLNDDLPGDYSMLSAIYGSGEVRYGSGSMVVAPPSEVNGNHYSLIEGDFRNLPMVSLNQIMQLIDAPENIPSLHAKYVRYANIDSRKINLRALDLLNGESLDDYTSRSEAEQAIITFLVDQGFSFFEIQIIFQKYPAAGKYLEIYRQNPENADRWLLLSYNNALSWLKTSKKIENPIARRAIIWALSQPWPGQHGSSDREIYLAHAAIALRTNKKIYGASVRELAELAAVSRSSASRANRRLIRKGLILLREPSDETEAAIYELIDFADIGTIFQKNINTKDCLTILSHDAFRREGLGKSALRVWQSLHLNGPMTVSQISKQTGIHHSTVRTVLGRMVEIHDRFEGEVINMVGEIPIKGPNLWYAQTVDLDNVAMLVGTYNRGDRQQEEHNLERKFFELKQNESNQKLSDSRSPYS